MRFVLTLICLLVALPAIAQDAATNAANDACNLHRQPHRSGQFAQGWEDCAAIRDKWVKMRDERIGLHKTVPPARDDAADRAAINKALGK